MQPNIQNSTVLFDMEEREALIEAYDTFRHGVNYENIPDCLQAKKLRLAEPNECGLTEITVQSTRSLEQVVVGAVRLAVRDKRHFVTEYMTVLDRDENDPLLPILQNQVDDESDRVRRFESLNKAFGVVLKSYDDASIKG